MNPLVGSLAFPHCSSECSYALSWIGKALRPFVDLRYSFALHGYKTSEVPATWGRSTGECRVSFQGVCGGLGAPRNQHSKERLVIKVTLADGTIVFHLMCPTLCLIAKCRVRIKRNTRFKSSHRWSKECFRQDVGEFSLARHDASSAFRNGGAKTAPLLERFPLGAATTVTPAWTGPWLRLDLGPARYRECSFHQCVLCPAGCGHLS